jgi:hypothetical protein
VELAQFGWTVVAGSNAPARKIHQQSTFAPDNSGLIRKEIDER